MTDNADKQLEERFWALADAVNKPKPKASDVAELRALLTEHRELAETFDLAATTVRVALNKATPRAGDRELMWAGYEAVRREMGYDKAPVWERRLIEHVALCWFRLQDVEQKYANVMAESVTLTRGLYWERRLSAAQRRYLRAYETLARVRRLTLPSVQVNIADKQVNVAS